MVWIGLFGGLAVGALIWGWTGAIIVGFFGWLGALIYKSRFGTPPVVAVPRANAPKPMAGPDRLQALEATVAELQRRVARLEGEPETVEEVIATPPPIPVAAFVPEPAPIPVFITEPKPIPAAPPPPAPPPVPATPTGPSLLDRLLEGNVVAKLGVVILFFGVAFLLKFAYDRGYFPPGMRLLAVAGASIALFFIGWRLLENRRTYALILMGGGMGLAYLDVFFALKTFGFISPALAFGLFAILGVATLLLAVRMDARAFATLGLLGAFMAPVLASTGSGQHVLLFSYYLLLNVTILAVSWFRSWRELNFVGFLFTFAIGLLWGHTNYRPELFATVEPFLIAFFALYLAIPILFAHRQPPELRGVVDGTLIFGVPLSAAMMQAALTRGMGDNVLAWSAGIVSVVYGVLAYMLWKRPNMRLLAQAHLALAIVFGTVAPYFALAGYPTFAFWTVEGAAIYWIACRQRSVLARAFALTLQVGAAAYFLWVTRDTPLQHPLWNDRVIGCALIGMASLATAWFMHRHAEAVTEVERRLEGWVIAWGGFWLLFGAFYWTTRAWPVRQEALAALLVFATALLVAMEFAGRALAWPKLRMSSAASVPVMAALALAWWAGRNNAHPLQGAGLWAWPLAFVAHFFVIHRQFHDGLVGERQIRYRAAWVLMLLLATWEVVWRQGHRDFEWVVGIGAVGIVAAALRYRLREKPVVVVRHFSSWILVWSLVWWSLGWLGLVGEHFPRAHHPAVDLALAAGSILIFELVGRAIAWPALRATQVLLPVAMLLIAVAILGRSGHPFANYQALAWLATFVVSYFSLHRQERDGVAVQPCVQHVLHFGAIAALLAWEAHWQVDRARLSSAWRLGAVGIVAAVALAAVTEGLKRGWQPFARHAEAFRGGAVLPLLLAALAWTLVANWWSDGTAAPWPYIPLLNALDLAQIALFAAAVSAVRPGGPAPGPSRNWLLALAVAGFFWINAVVLRTVHHWADVPFELHALLRSVVAQASLSLLWTGTALVMMFVAGRQRSRPLWMAGAVLLGVVVVKLFVNDLGNTGTVARIVSFIGVGVFMLLIGFLSPVPPRASEKH